jgi:RNA polymerase sigma factor (sigma-70 family)
MTVACHPLRRAVLPLARRAAPDAELLARFVQEQDQPAFAELVRRHGPTVLAVCRHVTRHSHDADDAFQATFLVLARKAHTLDPARPVGAWLRGVAARASRKAARRRPTLPLVEVARPEPAADPEAVAAVRAAVAGLPVHQRQAVERCELLGQSRAEAAGELGIRPGTLSSRLALARRALAATLRRRGFAPVAVPPALLASAQTSDGSSPAVRELAEAVMRTTWKLWAVAVGLAAAVGGGLAHEPAPVPRPAGAPVTGIVIGLTHEPIRVIDPDGRELVKYTAAGVRAAGSDLRQASYTDVRQTADGPRPLVVTNDRLAPAGRVRPDGVMPVRTRGGLDLLHPGGRREFLANGDYVAAWSPDGRRAVVGSHDGPKFRVLDTTTGDSTSLPLPTHHAVCGWSPDGDWLLTVVNADSPSTWLGRLLGGRSEWGIYRMALNGTVQARLTACRPHTTAALSPDGRRVLTTDVIMSDRRLTEPLFGVATGYAVRVLDVATGDARDLAHAPPPADAATNVLGAAWSPDGTRVAYAEQRVRADGDRAAVEARLVVCDVATGGRRVILTEPAGFAVFDWR